MNCEYTDTGEYTKILIDGYLHVAFKTCEFVGIQSWVEFDNGSVYKIEYLLKSRKIVSAFYEKQHWLQILELLNKNII